MEQATDGVYDEIFRSHAANLEQTRILNAEKMHQAVTLLDEAENSYICGFRASFPIAYSMYYVYRLFRKNVYLIDGHAGNIELFTRDLTPDDAVMIEAYHLDHTRYR